MQPWMDIRVKRGAAYSRGTMPLEMVLKLQAWAEAHRCEIPTALTAKQRCEINMLFARDMYAPTTPLWWRRFTCFARGHRFGPWHMTWEAVCTHDEKWVERICRRCGREEQRDA